MRSLALSLLLLAAGPAALAAPTHPSTQPTSRPGEPRRAIRWEPSLAAAKAKAARTGKPLFVLHLFGRLDEAFC